jgi:exonuclease III
VKILTWNCNLQFSKKSKLIDSFDADVLVIQECEYLPVDYKSGYQLFWQGRNTKKGLAVLVRGSESVRVESDETAFAYFLPIQTEYGLLVGVWSFNQRSKKFGIKVSGYLVDALETFENVIASNTRVIIAGDFNSGPRWDLKRFHRNNFRLIQEELIRRGFRSSYHEAFSEVPGSESLNTHFHQRNPDKGYHIDYVFSKGYHVDEVQVGEYLEWNETSDHVPLVVKLTD